MSESFSYDLSVPGSPTEAQARLRQVLTERLRQAAKMRLAGEDSSSLAFRPQPGWPLLMTAARIINGEAVRLVFTPDHAGTRVAVSGKVGGGAQKLATREFWAETLSAA